MTQTVQDALKRATFVADDQPYRLVQLPPAGVVAAAGIIAQIAEPFTVLIVDPHEVTMVIPDEAVADFSKRMPGHVLGERYRLITVDAPLEPTLIGFMRVLSTALADANVGVFPYAAFQRDHILVPEAQLPAALKALEALKTTMT